MATRKVTRKVSRKGHKKGGKKRSSTRRQRAGAWGEMSRRFSLYPRCDTKKDLPPNSKQGEPCSRLFALGPDNCADGYRCFNDIISKNGRKCNDYKCDLYDAKIAYNKDPTDAYAEEAYVEQLKQEEEEKKASTTSGGTASTGSLAQNAALVSVGTGFGGSFLDW